MIIHVDMDAFYAAVEIREQPQLASKPVIVGGVSGRGVVSTANYVARQYGIHSAMPVSEAKRRCKQLICLPVRMNLYAAVSNQIRGIFARYTPEIEPLSLDEAFLDVSSSEKLFGDTRTIGCAIKDAVLEETGLVCSVGMAKNKYIAKVASDIEKPDGFVYVAPEESYRFLDPLPVSRLWGAGKVTQEKLHKYGLFTIGDVRQQSEEFMQSIMGMVGVHFWHLAQTEDDRLVVSDHKAKSISHETTFDNDVHSRSVLLSVLSELTEQVGYRLRAKGRVAKTIKLKLRYGDFKTVSHSVSLPEPSDVTETFINKIQTLFNETWARRKDPVRLIGMGVSGIRSKANVDETRDTEQLDMFITSKKPATNVVDKLTDAINEKFGKQTVKRGRGLR